MNNGSHSVAVAGSFFRLLTEGAADGNGGAVHHRQLDVLQVGTALTA